MKPEMCVVRNNYRYLQYEDFIGLVDMEKTDATTLKSTIKDVLIRCNIQLSWPSV